MLPPMLLRSCRAATLTSLPPIRPPRLLTFSAVRFTTLRPAIVPLLIKSPLRLMFASLPASNAPLPSMSPGWTLT